MEEVSNLASEILSHKAKLDDLGGRIDNNG